MLAYTNFPRPTANPRAQDTCVSDQRRVGALAARTAAAMSNVESVKVADRVRPFNGREKDQKSTCILREAVWRCMMYDVYSCMAV